MKLQELVRSIESQYIKSNLPKINVGDVVRVGVLIQEGNKQRVQPFEGTVIAQHKAGALSTITVRKTIQNVGVERIFPIQSPCIPSVQIIRRSQVSRAKLYYLRNLTGKATRLKEKFDRVQSIQGNKGAASQDLVLSPEVTQ